MGQLDGKVALITGGNSGIGLATAKRFVAEGAKVAISGRDQSTLDAAVRELGENALAVAGDISKLEDIDRLIAATTDRFGKIDILFANAGIANFVPITDVDEQFFDQMFAVNVKGVFFTVQKALPHLNDGASIVVTSSLSNQLGMEGGSVYAATKAAVRSLVRTMAAEFASRRIRVNTLSPGPIETPIYGRLGMPPEAMEQMKEQLSSQVPLGRFGQADEVANVALFLASDQSSYVMGAEITVDGGMGQV